MPTLNSESIIREKIKPIEELEQIVAEAKAERKTVALANGCFDLLHVGHVRYLKGAKERADVLVVGINSDSSVRSLKGPERPYINERDRLTMIAAIEYVDYVTVFDSPTVDSILLRLKPDFHAKGTDYTEETVPEKDIVASYGGKVIITGDPKEHSSTNVIAKIKDKTGA